MIQFIVMTVFLFSSFRDFAGASAWTNAAGRSNEGQTDLMIASSHGNTELVTELLLSNTTQEYVVEADNERWTALMHVSDEHEQYTHVRHLPVANLLLARMDPEHLLAANKKGETALIIATAAGNHRLVELLLKLNSDKEHLVAEDNIGYSALTWAILQQFLSIVKLLLNHHPEAQLRALFSREEFIDGELARREEFIDFEMAGRRNQHPSLLQAMRNKANSLIQAKKNLNQPSSLQPVSKSEAWALFQALRNNNYCKYVEGRRLAGVAFEMFKSIFGVGAHVHAGRMNEGRTDLMIASSHGNPELVTDLLSSATTQDYVVEADKERWTALMHASNECHLPVVELLLARMDPGHLLAANNKGQTALILASANANKKLVRLLLEKNHDEELLLAKDNIGSTALMWAIRYQHLPVIEALLGCHPEAQLRALFIPAHDTFMADKLPGRDAFINYEWTGLHSPAKPNSVTIKASSLFRALQNEDFSYFEALQREENLSLVAYEMFRLAFNFEPIGRNQTSLMVASAAGDNERVNRLLKLNFGVKHLVREDVEGYSALMWAIRQHCPAVVKSLLNYHQKEQLRALFSPAHNDFIKELAARGESSCLFTALSSLPSKAQRRVSRAILKHDFSRVRALLD